MASNGTISDKTKFSWTILVTVVIVALSLAAFGYAVQGALAIHCADVNVHHSTTQLNTDYMLRAVSDQRYAEIIRRLDRIEEKIDK